MARTGASLPGTPDDRPGRVAVNGPPDPAVRTASGVRPGVEVEQFSVTTAARNEGAVVAVFGDAPVGDHYDEIRHPHGGEAMCHQDSDPAGCPGGLLDLARVSLEQRVFGFRV